MKINKMLWIIAMVLVLSIPSAFAQPAIFQNGWVILGTNIFIVWLILFILQAFIIPKKEGKEKVAIWVITFALAVVIVWNWGGRGDGYIWQIGNIASFFSIRKLVNFALIGGAIWFGLGLAGIDVTKTKYAQTGFILLTLLIAGSVANSIGDKWLWDTSNYIAAKNYLFEPQHTIQIPNTISQQQTTGYLWWKKTQTITTTTSTPQVVGGIFRPEEVNGYRLWVFLISALLFIWFFTGFLMPNGDKKLSWLLAIIIAANLARYGTPLTTMVGIAEAFAIIMIGKQITTGSGTVGGIIGWLITIALVEWIFCTVFGLSLSILLSRVFNAASSLWIIGKLFSGFATMISTICPTAAAMTGTGGGGTTALTIPGVTPGAVPPGTIPPISPPSGNGWGTWIFGSLAAIIGSLLALRGFRVWPFR